MSSRLIEKQLKEESLQSGANVTQNTDNLGMRTHGSNVQASFDLYRCKTNSPRENKMNPYIGSHTHRLKTEEEIDYDMYYS